MKYLLIALIFLNHLNSSAILGKGKFESMRELQGRVFTDFSTPLPFLNFLVKNPFPEINLFKTDKEVRELLEEENETQMDKKNIDALLNSSPQFRSFEDPDQPKLCRVVLKTMFLMTDYKKDEPLTKIPHHINTSCPKLRKSCCSQKDFHDLLSNIDSINEIVRENYKYLKKIIKLFRILTKNLISHHIEQNISKFRSCNPKLTAEKFLSDFDILKENISAYPQKYTEYMNHRISDTLSFYCAFCDFKTSSLFRMAQKQNLYYIRVKYPTEVTDFYKKMKEFESFIPLIAFGNMIQCLNQIDFNREVESRDMDYRIIKTQDLEQLEGSKVEDLKSQKHLLEYFESNYVPGVLETPLFINTYIRLAFFNKEEDDFKELKIIPIDKMFSKTIYTMKILEDTSGNSNLGTFIPENIVFRYAEEGFNNKDFEFKDKHHLSMLQFNEFKFSSINLMVGFLALLFLF